MTPPTLLPGKDASLEETIAKATARLKSMSFETEAVSWLNPAPDCWSVHLRSTACAHLYTNGKGTSRMAAEASALGEFFERLATNYFFADCFLDEGMAPAPFLFYPDEKWFPPNGSSAIPVAAQDGTELLTDHLRRFYNGQGELTFEDLCDHNSDSSRRGVGALPFIDLATGRTVYFPVSLLNTLYVSNGMAAGNSRAECCSQALSEIVERYVKNIIISKGICLPDVPMPVLRRYPRLCRILDRLAADGLVVRVKDGSLGGKFPVICALLIDTGNGGVSAAFGANLRFETAIERTLTELLQGRNLEGLKHFQPPCHDLAQVADPFNLESHFVDADGLLAWSMFRTRADFSFSSWDFDGSTEQELHRLHGLFSSRAIGLFRAEYRHLGIYSCRIVAPGMSEIYPVDDLIYNNRTAGTALRPDLLQLPGMDQAELAGFLDRLEGLGLNDQQLLAPIIGILFDDNCPWATLRIGELKALLLLALRHHGEALHWCAWCLDYAELPVQRRRLYTLLHTLLGFSLADHRASEYDDSLTLLYQDEEIQTGRAIVDGRTRFPGLAFAPTWSEIAQAHRRLLDIYGRLSAIKGTGGLTPHTGV